MATLVFTAVGTAIGGPIGGMIGSIVGQQIDNALFAPKARQGPRLGDLAVQTSSYGTAIPKIFGTLRVAGTVIWATDLKESKSSAGGGKGKPKVTTYSYSASFAVALSGRPIREVRRIWADGKLLRGSGGDFKSRTKYRLYKGGENQPADPLIASREGIGATPAFRGIAYAMFEDFQLADYGNRIPWLTFEVVAEDGVVSIAAMTRELTGGALRSGEGPSLGGYAASGDSVRGAIEPLFAVMPLSLVEDGEGLVIGPQTRALLAVGKAETGPGTVEISRRASGMTPGEVSIAYHDPARDYQTGLQRATRNVPGARTEVRALPVSSSSSAAKGFAEYRLKALWVGRDTAKVRLGWRRSAIRPGDMLALEGEAGLWKVERLTLERMAVEAELVRVPGGLPQAIDATPGRSTEQDDAPAGETLLVMADLPLAEEDVRMKPLLLVAAAGTQAGWRQADLIVSYDDGASWEAGGTTARGALLGKVIATPGAGGSAMIDTVNAVEVELPHDEMWLESCDDDALAAGANLALIGAELVQFGRAEPLGDRRFRLSRLLRGRKGTEWATVHGEGEIFFLIDRNSLMAVEPSAGSIGARARIVAQGIGDLPEGVEADCTISGEALRPPAPVHLRAARAADGGLDIRWVRRSRAGWQWLDGSETPLGEERERYEVRLTGLGFDRRTETDAPFHLYDAATQALDGHPAFVTVEIVQIGTLARSRPASSTFDIQGFAA